MTATIAEWVAGTGFAEWATGSSIAYPLANIVHVLALVLLLGSIGLIDLRILGLFRAIPLPPLAGTLIPVAAIGLLVLTASGAVLFAADARTLAQSGMFRFKLTLLAAALVNVGLFHWVYGKTIPAALPRGARIISFASLLLWTGIAISGRMIAYS